MKRITNYRAGDRAEKLGVVLLQAFSAVAEIPRQEDFGLADFVATLLRRDGRFWFAEDSFLVQAKSRTCKRIEYIGDTYKALLEHDLPLLVARVNLESQSVELHTLGVALWHPNLADASGIVAYLAGGRQPKSGLVDGVLNVQLNKPLLRWSVREIECRDFADLAYRILKKWFEVERWNRRHRQAGLRRHLRWETNAVPMDGVRVYHTGPDRYHGELCELVPFLTPLTSHAGRHPELRWPTLTLLSWIESQGVEADPGGVNRLMLLMQIADEALQAGLKSGTGADVAAVFCVLEARDDFLDFWLFMKDRANRSSGARHAGTLQMLTDQGFAVGVERVEGDLGITLGFSDSWLSEHNLAPLSKLETPRVPGISGNVTPVFLLKNAIRPEMG